MLPSKNVTSFKNDYLKAGLHKIHNESKSALITGYFNVNLINYKLRRETRTAFYTKSSDTISVCKLRTL